MKPRLLILATLATLATLLPALAAAQTPAQRIEAARARAAQARVPVELVDVKVAEGRAKGVAPERIAAAAERRADALIRAQAAMALPGRTLTRPELSAGADAVDGGVDGPALRSVVQAATPGHAAIALAVLTELHAQGIPVDRALEMVRRAMQRGDQALSELPAQAEANRQGTPAGGPGNGHGNARGRPEGVGGGPPAGVPTGKRPHPPHPAHP